MSDSSARPRGPAFPSPVRIWGGGLALALATIVAYRDSFRAPFVFDDLPSIIENPAVHGFRLDLLLQPGGLTTSGRPLVTLSFALNHSVHGLEPWGYHAVNLAIHLAASLLLFGLVRRTALLPSQRATVGGEAFWLGLVVAACWSLHPLPTAAVTYIVQRAEALAALFCLATLYAFVRAVDSPRPAGWLAGSAVLCALGMASKETAVAIPLLVLLYDRTFVSGAFRAAWARHRHYYLALAMAWLLLGGLILATAGRGGTAGLGVGASVVGYALTQAQALVLYFGLALWPASLVFDYGMETVQGVTEVLPQLVVVVLLAGFALAAPRRWPVAGFLAAAFLLLLAPSSSVVPVVTQTVAEHRFYLPLALLITGGLLAVRRLGGPWIAAGMVAAAAWGLLATPARVRDYGSEVRLWADTAAKRPTNARAHNNLGQALFRQGRVDEALASYRRALALQPRYPETHYNVGVALGHRGEWLAAVESYQAALRWDPAHVEAHNNLGGALVRLGRLTDAIQHLERALEYRPDFAAARNNLGSALLQAGRRGEAVAHLRWATSQRPDDAEGFFNLGNAIAAGGDMGEALQHYERALVLRPAYPEALINAGNALLTLGRAEPALERYVRAVKLRPDLADAHYNAGAALLELERWGEAVPHLESALALVPRHPRALRALGFALARQGRVEQALGHYLRLLEVAPEDAEARAEYLELRAAAPGERRR